MEDSPSKKLKSHSTASQSGAASSSGPGTSASTTAQVDTKEAVETSTVEEVTAGQNTGDAVAAAAEGKGQIFPEGWLSFREIFVQYIPGKPYALAEFGAFLYSHQGRHEFRDIDGTGLARAVGLRDRDVLLSINNLEGGVKGASPRAVLESLSDIGTNIGLVIERKRKEIWLFAFHLDEEGNRPVVKGVYSYQFDLDIKSFSFPLKSAPILDRDLAFKADHPVYAYNHSIEVEVILKEGDRYMEIDTDKATYIERKHTLTLSYYQRIDEEGGVLGDDGIPIAISTGIPTSSNKDKDLRADPKPMCIEAVGDVPLRIVVFPSWMTEPNTRIPQNNMFFFMSLAPSGDTIIKGANTQQDLYITHMPDSSYPEVWIANLGSSGAGFRIESNGRVVKSLEELLKIFTAKES